MIKNLSKKELLKLIKKSETICLGCGYCFPIKKRPFDFNNYNEEWPINKCFMCDDSFCNDCLVPDSNGFLECVSCAEK